MNTFFKISYVNWSLLFISCCYLSKKFLLELEIKKFMFIFLPCFLIASSFFIATSLSRPAVEYSNIRGLDYINKRYEGVKGAVLFLSKQESGTVLEAQGPPYSETAMLATLTGFPSFLGWVNHLGLLMPDKLTQINKRVEIVDNIYRLSLIHI